MRAEEYDWILYHIIAREKNSTIEDLCEHSGFSQTLVEESLSRLTRTLLVECRADRYRVCSFEEFLITSRMNQDPLSDIIIENGVVKVKQTSIEPDTKYVDSAVKP